MATRIFLKRTKEALQIPVLGLFDSDAHGLKILSVYVSRVSKQRREALEKGPETHAIFSVKDLKCVGLLSPPPFFFLHNRILSFFLCGVMCVLSSVFERYDIAPRHH